MTSEAVCLLRANGPVYIDGTFAVTPNAFSQTIIIMVFDVATSCYIPCIYALLTGKNEWLYLRLLHEVIMQLDYQWEPSSITCDFEMALIKAVKQEFPSTILHGCYFHWTQALFKKLVKFGIGREESKNMVYEMKFMTALNDIDIKLAIEFLAIKHTSINYTRFFNYFESTWTSKYPSSLWTFSLIDSISSARTNNALERYNRQLKEQFACPHPSIIAFLQVIKDECRYYRRLLDSIRGGREPFPKHEESPAIIIPEEFIAFRTKFASK
jgi:hypothetical protein